MSKIEQVKAEIIKLKERISGVEHGDSKLSETDTRQGLINPLFRVLGWDFSDFNSIKSEIRHASYNEPVDYAFYSSRDSKSPILLLEAKALGTTLSSGKIVKQLCAYLGEMGVQWGVLSDGNKYVMYNSRGGDSFDDQKFLTLSIKTVDTEDGLPLDDLAEKFIALLSRECLEDEKIQRTYEEHMVDSQIESALESLLSEPFDTLAAAIRKEFKEERVKANPHLRIKTDQIISYLKAISDEEGRILINSENGEDVSSDEVIHSISESTTEQNHKPSVHKDHRRAKRIAISDLIADGLAHEGDNWKLVYKGEVFWGRVTGNGELEVNGELIGNPSKAGTALTGRPCAGWNAWYYKNQDGEWSKIEDLRKTYRENHGLDAVKWKKKPERSIGSNLENDSERNGAA